MIFYSFLFLICFSFPYIWRTTVYLVYIYYVHILHCLFNLYLLMKMCFVEILCFYYKYKQLCMKK